MQNQDEIQKINAMAAVLSHAATVQDKIASAWKRNQEDPDMEYMRPAEIQEELAKQLKPVTPSEFSVVISNPVRCGLIDRHSATTMYRLSKLYYQLVNQVAAFLSTTKLADLPEFADQPGYIKPLAKLYEKVGNVYTWALICYLIENDASQHNVTALVDVVNTECSTIPGTRRMHQPEITNRLKYLENLGLVLCMPSGKYRYYRATEQLVVLWHSMQNFYSTCGNYFLINEFA